MMARGVVIDTFTVWEEEVMGGLLVQCITGDQALTMVVRPALSMTGTEVMIMVGRGVLNMADTAADLLFEGRELEEPSGSVQRSGSHYKVIVSWSCNSNCYIV